eukprot:4829092-Prymnesium_polylepis.1
MYTLFSRHKSPPPSPIVLLREVDHAALIDIVDRVELRVLLVAEHHRMRRRGLRRRVPHAQHRVVRPALV